MENKTKSNLTFIYPIYYSYVLLKQKIKTIELTKKKYL